jgi:fosfomycin resistance protein FosX
MPSILHHVALIVADRERSARIFELLFSAKVVLPGQDHRGPPEVLVRMPGLDLVFVKGQAPTQRADSHIAFAVRPSELVLHREKLVQLGIQAAEPRQGPQGRALYFVDYDNHLFELNAGSPLAAEAGA